MEGLTVARLEGGMFVKKEVETDSSMAADRFHEKAPRVLSTASLIGIMQSACADVMAPFLGSNEMVVSIKVEMSHFGAVPVGTRVKLTTRIVEVKDRQVIFSVEASDRGQTIASGRNHMFIIDKDRFEKGIERYNDGGSNK
ncbi:MAG: hypothetical protein GKS04_02455 [Candidatus Mycalebacterium zealandia]|nr:MAG: hypothetical protein GKS04_02455 [Candidatus Mycalebacterium zealandia]